MAKFYYTNENGQKEGPVCQVQLQELVIQGSIEPDTQLLMLHEKGGAITTADNIPGLSFNTDLQDQEPNM